MVLIRPLEALLWTVLNGDSDTTGTEAMMTTFFASEGEQWTAEQYGTVLEEAFLQEMGEEIGIREYRQISAAFSSQWLSKWTDVLVDIDEATFEQQGHTTATHDREYDRINGQSHGLRQHNQLRYELASMQWQKLVFPKSTITQPKEGPQPASSTAFCVVDAVGSDLIKAIPLRASNASEPLVTSLAAINALRMLLNCDKATFRSEEQAKATALLLLQGEVGSSYYRKDALSCCRREWARP